MIICSNSLAVLGVDGDLLLLVTTKIYELKQITRNRYSKPNSEQTATPPHIVALC